MATEKFEKYLGGWEIKLASLLTKMKHAKNKEFVSDVKRFFEMKDIFYTHRRQICSDLGNMDEPDRVGSVDFTI